LLIRFEYYFVDKDCVYVSKHSTAFVNYLVNLYALLILLIYFSYNNIKMYMQDTDSKKSLSAMSHMLAAAESGV